MSPGRVAAVVQARLGSVRMPGKVLTPFLGRPSLSHLLERLGRASLIDTILLAIPDTTANDELERFAQEHGVGCVRGSERDVLARFANAAEASGASIAVRITADCPLVDPALVDRLVAALIDDDLDYAHTGTSFPDGFDVEVLTVAALRVAAERAVEPYDREHVTPYVRRHAERMLVLEHDDDLSAARVTLDEPADAEVLAAVFGAFGHNEFSMEDVVTLMREQPTLFDANRRTVRNEGATMGTGEKLWGRAKAVIPGGNMLLSKRPDMHLPQGWPAYFSRAKGCRVWDLDDNELIDVGFMGIGTNILGYGHPKVDEAVRRVVDAGNMSTLNCPEEVALAERLIALHPWSDMARFTRSGGEACAMAVRIARAASGRDGVAFCGYHGWHDWYLAANLAEDAALDGHLLPGLDPAGVPRGLIGTARPFPYGDLAALETLLDEGSIGVVFMEVQRFSGPPPGFLEGARALADRHDAVLVFDECTSGFRQVLGGMHLVHGVEPDIVVLGKTLGNGYAINAVLGREAVMQAVQDTFISSTFWTERIGSAAALAALDVMQEEDAPRRVHELGLDVRRRWLELAATCGLPLEPFGIIALSGFAVPGLDAVAVKTFVTQELLAKGYLATTSLYASIAHDDEVLDRYFADLVPVFEGLAQCGSDDDLLKRLPHGPAQSGFKRLA